MICDICVERLRSEAQGMLRNQDQTSLWPNLGEPYSLLIVNLRNERSNHGKYKGKNNYAILKTLSEKDGLLFKLICLFTNGSAILNKKQKKRRFLKEEDFREDCHSFCVPFKTGFPRLLNFRFSSFKPPSRRGEVLPKGKASQRFLKNLLRRISRNS